MRMSRILDPQKITTLFNMITASKQRINLLETNLFRLGDKEPHKGSEQEVDARKHVKGVEAAVLEKGGEELLDDAVGDVLGLRGHADGLGADVHGEDFAGPDPGRGAPGWFV